MAHLWMVYLLKMVIFHSYVILPEGIITYPYMPGIVVFLKSPRCCEMHHRLNKKYEDGQFTRRADLDQRLRKGCDLAVRTAVKTYGTMIWWDGQQHTTVIYSIITVELQTVLVNMWAIKKTLVDWF